MAATAPPRAWGFGDRSTSCADRTRPPRLPLEGVGGGGAPSVPGSGPPSRDRDALDCRLGNGPRAVLTAVPIGGLVPGWGGGTAPGITHRAEGACQSGDRRRVVEHILGYVEQGARSVDQLA